MGAADAHGDRQFRPVVPAERAGKAALCQPGPGLRPQRKSAEVHGSLPSQQPGSGDITRRADVVWSVRLAAGNRTLRWRDANMVQPGDLFERLQQLAEQEKRDMESLYAEEPAIAHLLQATGDGGEDAGDGSGSGSGSGDGSGSGADDGSGVDVEA